MKPVRLFRHINCSSPGYLGEFLENRGVPFEIACTGVEHFNLQWLIKQELVDSIDPRDVQTTLAQLTASTLAAAN